MLFEILLVLGIIIFAASPVAMILGDLYSYPTLLKLGLAMWVIGIVIMGVLNILRHAV